jgi:predicted ATP-dependent endonuclease of OLD family
LVTRRGITSSVRPVREQDELKFVKLELGHNNTDLYEFNVVVFVEGDSEVVGFPIIASTIGLDFVKAGIRIINAKGSGKAKKIEQYLEYLRDSDTIPFVIADGDKEVRKKLADWEGAGILPKGNYRMWDMEFEDLFPIDLVAQCCGELGYRDITLEKLKELQSSGSVVHAIRRILYEAGQRELDKPSLAEAMANKAAEQSRIPKRLEETLQALAKCAQSMNPGLRLSVDWSLSVS